MKKAILYINVLIILGTLLTSCSQNQKQQNFEYLFKDTKQRERVLTMMAEDHDLSSKYISKMMQNEHATGMMVDKLVTAASEDTVLAGKISDMITKFPDLMLLTTHHFMPVINADEHMCDGFCDHAMEHSNIADKMCHKIQEKEEMNCCQ